MFNENTKYYTHNACTWFRERNNQIELRFVWTILCVKIISCKKLGACWKISGLKIPHPLIYWSRNFTTNHIYLKAEKVDPSPCTPHGAMSRLWYWLYVFNATLNSTVLRVINIQRCFHLDLPPVFGGVRVAHLFSFLCCFIFVCLRPVSCVPNVASVSGLSFHNCPFGFL